MAYLQRTLQATLTILLSLTIVILAALITFLVSLGLLLLALWLLPRAFLTLKEE